MNIAIIYHDADFDGKLSNEACRFHLSRIHPDARIESYGWDYGRAVPVPTQHEPPYFGPAGWKDYDQIYIVDLSVDELMERTELRDKIVWIDHHKSAIEKWDTNADVRNKLIGYRIDGVAACRLCWQWFAFENGPHGDPRNHPSDWHLPQKEDYVKRAVSEPALLRLAGEYDIWDHRDPRGKALQFGLRSLSADKMADLIQSEFQGSWADSDFLIEAIIAGYSIKSYCDKNNFDYAKDYAQTIQWEGLTFCALNIGQRGNSDLLLGGIKPEHDALFTWRWTGLNVMVSLYHAPGKEHHDLSKIAVKYGGGGHRGACGFRLTFEELSPILNPKGSCFGCPPADA